MATPVSTDNNAYDLYILDERFLLGFYVGAKESTKFDLKTAQITQDSTDTLQIHVLIL